MNNEDIDSILDQCCGADPVDVETIRRHIFRCSEKLGFIGQCIGDNAFECAEEILSTSRELEFLGKQVLTYERTR